MAARYLNTDGGADGTGTLENPWTAWGSVSISDGDSLLIKTGTSSYSGDIPAGLLSADNITIAEYGTGAKPELTGGVVRADWTLHSGSIYKRTYAGNACGNITEDGVPMVFVTWPGSVPALAAGSFTFDYTGFVLYMRPSAGAPASHVYIASEDQIIFSSSVAQSGLTIRNLALSGASAHGVLLLNRTDCLIEALDLRVFGGLRSGSSNIGNGIELANGCARVTVQNCVADDIFDSAYTSQIYGSAGVSASDQEWLSNVARRCGLAAHENAIIASATQSRLSNIRTADLDAEDIGIAGVGWSGDRSGTTYSTYNFAGATSRIHNCRAERVVVTRAKKLWVSHQTGGVNYMSDSYGSGLTQYLSLSNNGAAGLAGQAEVWSNVTDDLARVPTQGTYGTYVQATGGISSKVDRLL